MGHDPDLVRGACRWLDEGGLTPDLGPAPGLDPGVETSLSESALGFDPEHLKSKIALEPAQLS